MRSLIPWKWGESLSVPDNTVTKFKKEMDDLFNKFFGSKGWLPISYFSHRINPVLDISETNEDVIVKVELPGVNPKEIEVNLSGTTLTIKGEKKEECEENTENTYRIERSHGSFLRSITLPCEVDEEKMAATFKNGVLSLKLPKGEPAKKKSIKIDMK